MKISNTFEVARPVDAVWEMFADVPAVAQCLPGAELTTDRGEGTYDGSIQIKLGPMSATFEGTANVARNDATRTGQVDGKGVDRSGGSRGQVKVNYGVAPAGGGSSVTVEADISLSGPMAQFGRSGLVEEITRRLIDEFVDCLEAKMSADSAEEAASIQAGEVKGIALFLTSITAWLTQLFKRLLGRAGSA